MAESIEQKSKKTKRILVLAAVMLAMFMNAIEGTIVSTAMPAIVSDLGGFSLYSWVFSSYLLMNAVTVLIYGKLSDLIGRKPVLLFGIVVFLAGSLLCGLADSMHQLIMFRFLQGIGAGAVAPVASTIIGDIYKKEERAHVQGYLSSVWGISAVLGPVLGGVIVENLTWRLIFWVNLPLGLLSMGLLWFFLHESIQKKKNDIDYGGAVLLTSAVSAFMLILVEGGQAWDWLSLPVLGLGAFGAAAVILFIRQERKASEPVMPFEIWQEWPILTANIVSLTAGIITIGLTSFLPTYVQGVMEKSPTVAGFTLTAMSISWPAASTIGSRMMLRSGFRNVSLTGGGFLAGGSMLLAFMPESAGPLYAALGSLLVGAGMGLTSTSFIVMIQSTVSWHRRGIATALNMFMRNLGNSIGAALLGGIMNSTFQHYLNGHSREEQPLSIDAANQLLNTQERAQMPIQAVKLLQQGLSSALHNVYLVVLVFGLASFFILLLSGRKQARKNVKEKQQTGS